MSSLTCPLPPLVTPCRSPAEFRAPIVRSNQGNIFALPPECFPGKFTTERTASLDHENRITHVTGPWDGITPFVRHRNDLVGRSIDELITNDTVRECFRALFERVRTRKRTVRMMARCDHGVQPRAQLVTFAPFPAGEIDITWTLITGPLAREVAAAPRRHFRHGELLRMCSWCRDVHTGTSWQHLEDAAPSLGLLGHHDLPPITHGICPACSAALSAENAAYLRLRQAV